ncbi:MAG: DUF6069 family protein [Gordonia sp. (in: high G+C Gram-positive bacteria)]
MSYRDPRDRPAAGYGQPTEPYHQPYPETHNYRSPASGHRFGPNIAPGLFAGGVVMSGVVTALAAWLVAWVIRTIAQRASDAGILGVWNPVARGEVWFAVTGFLCALAAGAFWYVLQLITPSPDQFFRWIVGLLIAAAVIVPLVLSAQLSTGIGTAVMHLVIGLPLFSLIPAMGQKSLRR